jgi:hypothetical protein
VPVDRPPEAAVEVGEMSEATVARVEGVRDVRLEVTRGGKNRNPWSSLTNSERRSDRVGDGSAAGADQSTSGASEGSRIARPNEDPRDHSDEDGSGNGDAPNVTRE